MVVDPTSTTTVVYGDNEFQPKSLSNNATLCHNTTNSSDDLIFIPIMVSNFILRHNFPMLESYEDKI